MENISLINLTLTAGSSAPKAEIPQQNIKTQQVPPAEEDKSVDIDPRNQDQSRFEAIKKAAEQIKADAFPVSDVRFTIYKETSVGGEAVYVTRFTSLRDGKVTIVPEQQMFSNIAGENGTILEALA